MRYAALLLSLIVVPMVSAQDSPPLTPSEAHERLAFFVGSWTVEESDPARDFRETCDWMPGGRHHVVCRSTWVPASGPREGMSIFSYRDADATYLYHGFRSGGRVETQHGTVSDDGQTWSFSGEQGAGEARSRVRVTITGLEGGRFRFEGQTAEGDGPWSDVGVSHYRPLADAP